MGLLARRPVTSLMIHYIGKEANELEEVEEGLVHDWDEIVSTYIDRSRDEWTNRIVPLLKTISKKDLAGRTGLCESTVKRLRNGRTRPRARTVDRVVGALNAPKDRAG